jgi:hypothetical protein
MHDDRIGGGVSSNAQPAACPGLVLAAEAPPLPLLADVTSSGSGAYYSNFSLAA